MGEFKDINKPIQRLKNRLPEYAQGFIDDSLNKRSPKTVYEYAKGLNLFFTYLSKHSSTEIKDVDIGVIKNLTTTDIQKYQDYISAGNNSIKSNKHKDSVRATAVENRTICLRRLFAFLIETGLIDNDPAKDLPIYRPSKKEFEDRFVNDTELEKLIPMNEKVKEALQDYIKDERTMLLRGKDDPALLISLRCCRMNPESIRHMLKKYGKSIGMEDNLTTKKLYSEKSYVFYTD